jgi:hypothetical protein
MNLAREIMLALESSPHGLHGDKLSIDGYSEEQIGYHVHLLGEAGLLKVVSTTSLESRSPSAIPLGITWQGHEFLDAARSKPVWSKALTRVGELGGSVPFSVLGSILEALLKDQLGL